MWGSTLPLPFDFFTIIIALLIGLYVFIRKEWIDESSFGLKECLFVGVTTALLVDSVNEVENGYTSISLLFRGHDPVYYGMSFIISIVSPYLADIAGMSLIALGLGIGLKDPKALWKLFGISVLGPAAAILCAFLIIPLLGSLQGALLPYGSFIFPNLTDLFKIERLHAWIVGFFMVFGCLQGFRFGLRSALRSQTWPGVT